MDIKALVDGRHAYAKDWKARTGGKVIGWYEPYFPEEIAYAAGALPVRVLARHENDFHSDKWIYASCYPVRDMVNQFLLGRYDYVDAIVNVEGCQWMYNAFEVAANNNPALGNHYLFLPDYTDAPTSKYACRSEFSVFKTKMEEWTGNRITDEKLNEAIEIYNKNRMLLKQISELRRMDRTVVKGSEFMNLLLADQVRDKAEMNLILAQFLKEVEDRVPGKDFIRLMLIGSETWDSEFEELVESLGANIVIDELDNGSAYYWNSVVPMKDPLMALAMRYLGRPHNPIKDNNWRRRPEQIFQLSEDYAVDGAIVEKQTYCHLHGSDNYIVFKTLRERNIPYHFFERSNKLPKDEMIPRIEAFLNMLKPGLNHLAGWHKKFGDE